MIVGLDLAQRAGIAMYDRDSGIARTLTIRGNPIEQFAIIVSAYNDFYGEVRCGAPYADALFLIEKLVHFRNANTTRSLLGRTGYVEWCLIEHEFQTKQIYPYAALKSMQGAYKELPPDERSALMLVHEQLEMFEPFQTVRWSAK